MLVRQSKMSDLKPLAIANNTDIIPAPPKITSTLTPLAIPERIRLPIGIHKDMIELKNAPFHDNSSVSVVLRKFVCTEIDSHTVIIEFKKLSTATPIFMMIYSFWERYISMK